MRIEEELTTKLGAYPGKTFQYKQVRGLINSLRQCRNIFKPSMEFERLLKSQRTQKGHLSRIYSVLIGMAEITGKSR